MFKNHVMTKEREGWHKCGTYQINLDAKVNNGIIKVESKCNGLQRIIA